jgi:murein hydrolase activator
MSMRTVQRMMLQRVVVLALSGLLVTPTTFAAEDDAARLEALKADIARLQEWLNQASSEHDKLASSLQTTDKDINDLSRKIEETQRLLQEEQASLKKSYHDQSRLRELEAGHRARLQAQIRAAHRLGGDSPIKLLLNQDDPQLAQSMLTRFGYFNRARIEQISLAVTELQRLARISDEIAAQEQQLRNTENALILQNQQLAQSRQTQKQLLASLEARVMSEKDRLRSKEADRKRLESLLQEVRTLVEKSARKNDARPFKSLKGQLPRPAQGKLLAGFGSANHEGTGNWEGWLISAAEGSDIRAVQHGRVVYSDWLRGYGLLMIIDHGDGYLTLYAHNQTLLYDVGAWVNQGDLIGTVGRSGGQRDATLYFEIRYRGKPLNPVSWIRRK